MKYSVRNVKIFNEGGTYFKAELYLDEKKVGTVQSDPKTSEIQFKMPKNDKDSFDIFVSDLPEINCPITKKKRELTPDEYIAALIDDFEWHMQLKSICKTKVLFRLKCDDKHSFRVVNHEDCKEVRDYLKRTYGEDLIEIANES